MREALVDLSMGIIAAGQSIFGVCIEAGETGII